MDWNKNLLPDNLVSGKSSPDKTDFWLFQSNKHGMSSAIIYFMGCMTCAVEVCKSDPNLSESDPIGFVRTSEQKYWFRIGSDSKLFRSRIGSDRISSLDVDHFFSLSFFYVFLVLYLIWLNIFTSIDWIEKFILLKDSSDQIGAEFFIKPRIGSDSDQKISDRIGFGF